jgi:hypothetical protein
MGFNYFNYGNIHPCGISQGKVFYILPSGKRVEFETKLNVEIPEQTNLFISDRVAFLLYHEDKMYIGRFDDSISIYRKSDELLVGLNSWKAPMESKTVVCGYYNNGYSITEIHLDLRDRRTVYICGENHEGVLKEEITNNIFDLDRSSFSASVFGDSKNYHIYTKGGNVLEVNDWHIQDDVRKRNCRIFL